ncbi:esterase/lipase [Auricularia subglabra TFB-10046 SS5]|nr:esterase/lipase [Auricularia subglabra TFB-10046 SS5]
MRWWLAVAALCSTVHAAGFRQMHNPFFPNRNGLKMYVYEPMRPQRPVKVLVALHPCGSSGPEYHNATGYAGLADKHGYFIIYPSSTQPDGCWDVHSDQTLTHHAGSDSFSIVGMVRCAVENIHVSIDHVYVTGTENGGMLAAVLAGAYPDMFKAAAIYGGVPFGCFSGDEWWNADCAAGKVKKTASEWGDLVRKAWPAYQGPRARIILWHGKQDSTVAFANYEQSLLQWSDVLGVDLKDSQTLPNYPRAGITATIYKGGKLIGYVGEHVNAMPPDVTDDLLWFDIAPHAVPTSKPIP